MKIEDIIKNIKPVDSEIGSETQKRIDSLIKPPGSLGRLEELAIRLSTITGSIKNNFEKKCIIIMSSDNGIVEEKVASSPQSTTSIQTLNILNNITGVGVLAKQCGSDIKVVDIGINGDISHPDLIHQKIRYGTSNMAKGPAMSRDEAKRSIEIGFEIANKAIQDGYSILGTGEMGIGNTSTASALVMSLLNQDESLIGRGAGLDDKSLELKKSVIKNAIRFNKPNIDDPIDVLSKVGGFDIGGLTGCYLAAAYNRVPILIDGVISAAGALVASRLSADALDYMIPSHMSAEPAYSRIIEELGLVPFMDMKMRLGEGSGCPLGFQIVDMACTMVNNMATFNELDWDIGV